MDTGLNLVVRMVAVDLRNLAATVANSTERVDQWQLGAVLNIEADRLERELPRHA